MPETVTHGLCLQRVAKIVAAYRFTSQKSRNSGALLLPRSCPLAFHTFAYHLQRDSRQSWEGVGVAVGVAELLIAATLAAPHSKRVAYLRKAFPLPGHALVRSKRKQRRQLRQLLTISCHFLHFLVHCFQFFPPLHFALSLLIFSSSSVFRPQVCGALSRATLWHLQTVAAVAVK